MQHARRKQRFPTVELAFFVGKSPWVLSADLGATTQSPETAFGKGKTRLAMSRHGVLGLRGDFQLTAPGGPPDRL
jgi:hypothetical protein